MATHKSAAKRARQAVRKTAVNSRKLNTVRTIEKKLRAAIHANDKAASKTLFNEYMQAAAKAAVKGIINPKTAARKTGRLATMVSK